MKRQIATLSSYVVVGVAVLPIVVIDAAFAASPASTSSPAFTVFDAGFGALLPPNPPKSTFHWTIIPPSPVSIRPDVALPLMVAVGPVAATGVKLGQPLLVEQSRLNPVGSSGLMLCRNETGQCLEPLALSANAPHTLYIRPNPTGLPVGKFVGTLVIAANEKPEGDILSLTVYSTTACRQWLGVLAIFLGVMIAWILTRYLHDRYNRDQLLLPAALLAQKAQSLRIILQRAPAGAKVTQTETALVRLSNAISPSTLEAQGLVPGDVPQPWTNPYTPATNCQQLLQQVSDWLVDIEAVVSDGMAVAWGELGANSSPAAKYQVLAAIAALDKLVDLADATLPVTLPAAPLLTGLRQNIAGVLNGLNSSLNAAGAPSVALQRQVAQTVSQQASTSQRLGIDIRGISLIAWSLIILLTTAIGSYVVVLLNLGFGLPTDYLLCLFWGFGLPTGGSQLLQLTSTQVTSTLGVAVQK